MTQERSGADSGGSKDELTEGPNWRPVEEI